MIVVCLSRVTTLPGPVGVGLGAVALLDGLLAIVVLAQGSDNKMNDISMKQLYDVYLFLCSPGESVVKKLQVLQQDGQGVGKVSLQHLVECPLVLLGQPLVVG